MSQVALKASGRDKSLARSLLNGHFLAAAGMMLASALVLYVGMMMLGWQFYPDPVPWTDATEVDEGCRLVSLSDTLCDAQGKERFALLKEDRDKDGYPDGDRRFRDEDKELLKIDTATDQARRPKRCSNWYFSRIYEDAGESPVPRRWHLQGYYYTGMMDQVPHVPEICLFAGGAEVISSEEVTFEIPNGRGPWKGKVAFRRTLYREYAPELYRYVRRAQYYVFSVNGEPVSSREEVRLKLMNPFLKRSYFAKVQFVCRDEVVDAERAKQQAEEFARCFMPEVLKMLPMPEDIKKLAEAGDGE